MPPLTLEDFAGPPPTIETAQAEQDESVRLQAYEEGYAAGWEDAASAHADARAEREAEVARHLQVLALGYHEARQHVLRSLEPLLAEVATRLLPATAREALGPTVLDALMPLAERMADTPPVLRTSPEARSAVERFLAVQTGLPLQIVEDATLSEGQVMISRGEAEARVDLEAATAAVTAAIRAYFDLQMERSNVG